MLRLISTLLILSAFAFEGHAQIAQKEEVGFLYNKETTFNFRFATNRSFGFGMEWGRLRTYNKTKTLGLGISEMKSPKEQRQSSAPSVRRSSRPIVYGKQNSSASSKLMPAPTELLCNLTNICTSTGAEVHAGCCFIYF